MLSKYRLDPALLAPPPAIVPRPAAVLTIQSGAMTACGISAAPILV